MYSQKTHHTTYKKKISIFERKSLTSFKLETGSYLFKLRCAVRRKHSTVMRFVLLSYLNTSCKYIQSIPILYISDRKLKIHKEIMMTFTACLISDTETSTRLLQLHFSTNILSNNHYSCLFCVSRQFKREKLLSVHLDAEQG